MYMYVLIFKQKCLSLLEDIIYNIVLFGNNVTVIEAFNRFELSTDKGLGHR